MSDLETDGILRMAEELYAVRALNADLLAALKALYDACEHRANQEGGDFGDDIGPAAEMAEAAIIKAEGK